jgi:hypothetical protein
LTLVEDELLGHAWVSSDKKREAARRAHVVTVLLDKNDGLEQVLVLLLDLLKVGIVLSTIVDLLYAKVGVVCKGGKGSALLGEEEREGERTLKEVFLNSSSLILLTSMNCARW